ncbi:hypothetical protein GGR58DRAFT_515248 [Xylaria digitata]|nr:hypothetical protein GGR58DRAFT_515248 [Xylaria digitata]
MAPPAPASKASTTPMSPPARLHLRNILPSSPEEPPIMPPPPRTPKAWVWQCHKCLGVYKLGCTRRCLDCSHTYCVSNPNSSSSSTRGKKRRRNTGLCGAEFDYIGWEQWGSWRRKVLGYEATGRCETKARDRAFLKKSHDCWIDCDSPSECCHRRFELAAEVLRKQQAVVKSAYRQPNPDDDIPITEVLHESSGDGDAEETPPKSPLGQSSFLWDEDEGEKETREEKEKWYAVRSRPTPDSQHDGSEAGTVHYPPGIGDPNWASVVDNHDYYSDSEESNGPIDRPVKRLSVRNLASHDAKQAGSDSDSESDCSDWSANSSESDNSSIETRAGNKSP